MEERAGERRPIFVGFPSPRSSPLLRRGARKKKEPLIQWQWGQGEELWLHLHQ